MSKGCKYLITANLQKLHLNIAFPVDFLVLWRRGRHKIETSRKNLNTISCETLILEALSMQACFQYLQNSEKPTVAEKKTSFSLVLLTQKAKKLAGTTTINLADYINKGISGINL